ncbi:MAG: hypothetical protein FJY43_10370, partial [Betaproteobacteria bacterium]|nr:hypothetical protein [Betaproteobacteria bacterium]
MSAPLTVAEWRAAALADREAAAALRARRQALAQGTDPAWISVASAAQLDTQLARLAQQDPAACP